MRYRGEVTVFLTMILISIMSFLLVTVESVRDTGARLYLRMAVDSSMDSVMAQYHRELWERYRLLGLETGEDGKLEEEFKAFFEPYRRAKNWYPMKLTSVSRRDAVTLTEGDGAYFEQEILDYMKYGLTGMIWDGMEEGGALETLEQMKDAEGVNALSGLYDGHTREAVRVEEALEKINAQLIRQKEGWNRGMEYLNGLDGDGFIRQAKDMIKALKQLPSLVNGYEKKADHLNEKLKESRQEFENQEDLSSASRKALEEELDQYEAYTRSDGERRMEIAALEEKSRENIIFLEQLIGEAEDIIDYIDNWEPEDEEDELDENELWDPVRRRFSRYPMLSLGMEFGIRDKEKEGWLERIGDLAAGGILELVLPPETVVSGKKLDQRELPSEEAKSEKAGAETTVLERGRSGGVKAHSPIGVQNLLDRLLVSEYAIRYFSAFETKLPEHSFYQLEYILYGKKRDRDNLEASLLRLTALRQGLNLAHILGDPVKRQEARTLGMAIAGGTGMAPLAAVVSFFIMTIWALGEALLDVRCLLEGGRVPLVKSRSQWRLDLEGLLRIGAQGRLPELPAKEEGTGLDHKGYLRLMLFAGYCTEYVYRMMDVMQMEICRNQAGFRMSQCVCKVDMEAAVCGKPVFFSGGPWTEAGELRMEVSGSYLEDNRQ